MAEFKEILKNRKRICDSMDRYCINCPLKNFSDCETPVIDEWDEYEKTIVQWASEHPEPVYPTWEELMASTFPYGSMENACIKTFYACADCNGKCRECRKQLIPAEIAEKLGIAPIKKKEE